MKAVVLLNDQAQLRGRNANETSQRLTASAAAPLGESRTSDLNSGRFLAIFDTYRRTGIVSGISGV